MAKQQKINEKECQASKQRKRFFLNTLADQLILLIKPLLKIMLLFIKLSQF